MLLVVFSELECRACRSGLQVMSTERLLFGRRAMTGRAWASWSRSCYSLWRTHSA